MPVCICVCMYVCMCVCIMIVCMYGHKYLCSMCQMDSQTTKIKAAIGSMCALNHTAGKCRASLLLELPYACMYVGMYVCMYVCLYLCLYVHMYACMLVCMYVCMHVWV